MVMGFIDKVGRELDPSRPGSIGQGLFDPAGLIGGKPYDPLGIFPKITGEDAANQARDAAEQSAVMQREALELFQEMTRQRQLYGDAAIGKLGERLGIGFDPETGQLIDVEATAPTQEMLLEQAQGSPLYQAQLAGIEAGREAGQEAIARRGAMGAGLRGAGTTANLAGYDTGLELQKNQALANAYQQAQADDQRTLMGFQNLAGMPNYAGDIAGMSNNIANTLAQGNIAAANAQQQGFGNLVGTLGTAAAAIFSDVNLKTNIDLIGRTPHPEINLYEWNWRENAPKSGVERGYLAQEVEKIYPDLVITGSDGLKRIYKEQLEERLGVING